MSKFRYTAASSICLCIMMLFSILNVNAAPPQKNNNAGKRSAINSQISNGLNQKPNKTQAPEARIRPIEVTINVTYTADSTPKIEDVKSGVIKFMIYPDSTLRPIAENFKKLAAMNAYDNVLFHRVINNFMIQTGDPSSATSRPGEMLGMNSVQADGIIPMPFIPGQLFASQPRYHKYGAVAVARTGDSYNMKRNGSTSQFYIVTDSTHYAPEQVFGMAEKRRVQYVSLLDAMNQNNQMSVPVAIAYYNYFYPFNSNSIPDEVKTSYSQTGGAPYLDEDYTVIGEITEGMDVVEAIQKLPVDSNNRPIGYARITKFTVK